MRIISSTTGTASRRRPYRISTAGGNIGGPLTDSPCTRPEKPDCSSSLRARRSARSGRKGEVDLTVPTVLERQGNFSQSVVSGKAV